jgi:hypothetical protein
MAISVDFIRLAVEVQDYEISLHADAERLADGLTLLQVEAALSSCIVIEEYPNDPRGESCLVMGFTPDGGPVHVVCGRNQSGALVLITIYIPSFPKWKDPFTRNR